MLDLSTSLCDRFWRGCWILSWSKRNGLIRSLNCNGTLCQGSFFLVIKTFVLELAKGEIVMRLIECCQILEYGQNKIMIYICFYRCTTRIKWLRYWRYFLGTWASGYTNSSASLEDAHALNRAFLFRAQAWHTKCTEVKNNWMVTSRARAALDQRMTRDFWVLFGNSFLFISQSFQNSYGLQPTNQSLFKTIFSQTWR